MASWEQLKPRVQSIPASSEGVSEDSVSSREAWSVPVAKGLPSWASAEVSGSCLGVEGSLCATRGSPSGLHALLSASARKFSCQLSLTPFLPAFIHARSDFLGSPLSQAWCGPCTLSHTLGIPFQSLPKAAPSVTTPAGLWPHHFQPARSYFDNAPTHVLAFVAPPTLGLCLVASANGK